MAYAILFVCLGFVGFLDATYLTITHYQGTSLLCGIFHGCDIVTSSTYSTLGSIPTALLGVGYYLALFFLGVAFLDTKKRFFLRFASLLTPLGFFVSLILVWLQLFVIRAICTYCMISALTSTLLFIVGMAFLFFEKREKTLILSDTY